MLLDEFNKWCLTEECSSLPYKDNEYLFEVFYQKHVVGMSIIELTKNLAWQIYQLQVCIEGLIEDNS